MLEFEIDHANYADDSGNCITNISGKMMVMSEGNSFIEAGQIQATYVDLATALEMGECILLLFDSHSQELWECYEALYLSSSVECQYLQKMLMEKYGTPWPCDWQNLLYINRVEVYPLYRGRMLGLAAMNRLIQKFRGGCALIVLKAYPLQYEDDSLHNPKLELASFPSDNSAVSRLATHYEKIGFNQIPASHYMYYSPDQVRVSSNALGYNM